MIQDMTFGLGDPYFAVESQEELICPDITLDSSYILNLNVIQDIYGFEVVPEHHAVRNISNRSLNMIGSMAVQAMQTDGQPATLILSSERSSDGGTTWIKNTQSLRENYIIKTGLGYLSIPSYSINSWKHDELIRFTFSKQGNGGVTLSSASRTIDSQTVEGQSFLWEMRARRP